MVSLLPFYYDRGEPSFARTVFNSEIFSCGYLFAAISPGIIAFTLYTMAQKRLGASVTGFTLYISLQFIVLFMDIYFLMNS